MSSPKTLTGWKKMLKSNLIVSPYGQDRDDYLQNLTAFLLGYKARKRSEAMGLIMMERVDLLCYIEEQLYGYCYTRWRSYLPRSHKLQSYRVNRDLWTGRLSYPPLIPYDDPDID